MKEINPGILNYETANKPILQLVQDLEHTNKLLRWIHTVRDQKPLNDVEDSVRRELNARKNGQIFDLLHARNLNGLHKQFPATIYMYPGESIHEYSRNKFSINMPSTEVPGNYYYVEAELLDLTKHDRKKNSLDALKLLDKPFINKDEDTAFVRRTCKELRWIDEEKKLIRYSKERDNAMSPKLQNLEQLAADLISQRLIPLIENNSIPTEISIEFVAFKEASTERIRFEGMGALMNAWEGYAIITQGQRLSKNIDKIGGYNKIIDLNPESLRNFIKSYNFRARDTFA